MIRKLLTTLLIFGLIGVGVVTFWLPVDNVYGQNKIDVACGQILEGEFGQNAEEHIYALQMEPGGSFNISVEPLGDTLSSVIVAYGPTGLYLTASEPNYGYPTKNPAISSGVVSARGEYLIQVANSDVNGFSSSFKGRRVTSNSPGGVGVYTLKIGCTLRDGSEINPGDISIPITPGNLGDGVTGNPVAQSAASSPSFIEAGRQYEVLLYSGMQLVTIMEVGNDGWAKVDIGGIESWLNLNEVLLITPVN